MHQTETLYIKALGPIREAQINIDKVTVMIGEQGTGKSTIAKLYSLFSWLEKAFMRHSLTPQYVTRYDRFRKIYAAYNNLEEYFNKSSELIFNGIHYSFTYRDKTLKVKETENGGNSFNISKVMYVPAERGVLGSVDHPSRLKGLGSSLATFLEEYDTAKLKMKNGYALPFGEMGFEYDTLNDIAKLRHADFETKLSAASSGYQSALPLLLVSRHLSDMVKNSSQNADLSEKERKALQKEVEAIVNDTSLSKEVKQASLRTLSSRYQYSRFVNIVEEMELNLFPVSQRKVLYELLAETNSLPSNRLMLTTHSPYIINYLTLIVKTKQLAIWAEGNKEAAKKIYDIVPRNSMIASNELKIYELQNGWATELNSYEGLPSDENFLNAQLNDTNMAFDALLEIEEELTANGQD